MIHFKKRIIPKGTFYMKKLITSSLIFSLLCAALTPLYAVGPLGRRFPAKPVKLTAKNSTLTRSVSALSRTSVKGYTNTISQKTDRKLFMEQGTLGLNIHEAISLHEELYPHTKGTFLPTEFNKVPTLEKDVAELIEGKFRNWTSLHGMDRVILLESALPGYLAEPKDEEFFIPSASQLQEALSFYREVLGAGGNSGLVLPQKFGGTMSAISNLSLLGSKQDAPLILYAAQRDFEKDNSFVDYFATRALAALDAKKELQELADLRREQALTKHTQLPAVWRDINKEYNLGISNNLISEEDEPLSDFSQKDMLVHHPFNYVLLDPSGEVTASWCDLRKGIQEQFKLALSSGGQEAVEELPFTFEPPKLPTPEEMAARRQTTDTYISLSETDKLLRKKLYEDRSNRAAVKRALQEDLLKEKGTTAPTPQEIVLPPQRLSPQKRYAELRKELEEYVAENHQLPLGNSRLYKRVYGVVYGNQFSNPDAKVIKQIFEEYRVNKSILRSNVLDELKTYLREHDNYIPPEGSPLRNRVHNLLRRNHKDPVVEEIKTLWDTYKNPIKERINTPEHVLKLLEEYVAQYHTFPAAGSALRSLFHATVRNADPDDPDIRALRALREKYYRKKESNTPEHVRELVEQYVAKYQQFPHVGTSLRSIFHATVRNADPEDEDIRALNALHEKYAVKPFRNTKTPEQWLSELETFIQEKGRFPSIVSNDPQEHKIAVAAYNFRYKMKERKSNSPAVLKIIELTNDQVIHPSASKRHLDDLKAFVQKEGRLPTINAPQREEYLLARNIYNIRGCVHKQTKNDEYSLEIVRLMQEYQTKGGNK